MRFAVSGIQYSTCLVDCGFGPVLRPRLFRTHLIDQEADALVVGGIEPEHPAEDDRGVGEPVQAPKAQAQAAHAAEERSVDRLDQLDILSFTMGSSLRTTGGTFRSVCGTL